MLRQQKNLKRQNLMNIYAITMQKGHLKIQTPGD
jgi:hypothetical protein